MEQEDLSRALAVMKERFGHDTVLALATVDGAVPFVRFVNGYYEDGAFYCVTHARSKKMRQLAADPTAALCGEWFTARGTGENIGHPRAVCNAALAAKLRDVFSAWYANGDVQEDDPGTCILRVRLTDAELFDHGVRYAIDFASPAGI